LEISTGRFTYVNAGHTPPLLRCGGGAFEPMCVKPGLVLAGLENIPYKQSELILLPGDELFLYTDGITEMMMNSQNELFGEERLLQAANENAGGRSEDLLTHIKDEVFRFAGDVEQADDITMMALKICEVAAPEREVHMDA